MELHRIIFSISFLFFLTFDLAAQVDGLVENGLNAVEKADVDMLDSISDVLRDENDPNALIYENYFRGMAEFYRLNYEASEVYLGGAVEYSTRMKDTCWLARSLHNLAVIYFYQYEERKGIEYEISALELGSSCVDRSKMLLMIGASYRQLEVEDSAFLFLKQAITESKKTDSVVVPYALNHLGEWYSQQDSFDKAIQIRRQVPKWIDTASQPSHVGVYCNYLVSNTRDYFESQQADSGLYFYHTALSFAQKNELIFFYGTLFSHYANYWNGINEYDSATFYFMKAFAADENSRDKGGRLLAMENLTTSLENKVIISNLKGEKAGLQRNIAIITGLGILALSTLLIVLTRQRLKHQKVLRAQEEEKHGQQLQQVLSAHELQVMQALAEGQEHERKRLSQELHDTVGNMLATLKLQFESLSDLMGGSDRQNVKVDNTAKLIDETCVEVRRISHNLSTGMVSKMGLIAALRQLVATISSTGKFKIELNHDGDDLDVGGDTEVHLYRIIQEIISNAIKHSGADHISIQVTKHEKELNVIVEDDGKGFDLEQVKKNQKGIGLLNLESRVKHLGGELVIDSKKGRGTAIIIDIKF